MNKESNKETNKESNKETNKNPFTSSLLNMKVFLSFIEIGSNIKDNLKKKIEYQVEGKCIAEGLIIPNSIKIISYSSGKINMEDVEFQVVYQCNICLPVEGMEIECITKSITKAGIHAEYSHNDKPIIAIFITRDDNYDNPLFQKIKTSDVKITAIITGVIFELNDPIIAVTAELVSVY
jgi:DNA-directed RNA polymerase subunit E'/Rpb7